MQNLQKINTITIASAVRRLGMKPRLSHTQAFLADTLQIELQRRASEATRIIGS